MWALLASVLLFGQAPESPRLTLEVLNARAAGRSILSIDDTIGKKARTVGRYGKLRGVLVHALPAEGCSDCEKTLAALNKIHAAAVGRSGGVVVVVTGKPEHAKQARAEYGASTYAFPITFDGYGLSRLRLGLDGSTRTVVFSGDGQVVGQFGPMKTDLEQAIDALDAVLKREDG